MIFPARKILAQSARFIELAFFPSFCKICRRLLESPKERVLCRPCLENIKPDRSSHCLSCGRFFEGIGEPHLCSSCIEEPPPFAMHRSCARYRGELKDALLLFKYRRFKPLGKNLAGFVFETQKKEDGIWWDVDAIIPVPLHPRRIKERGFNQARVLAKELGRIKGIPIEGSVLKKIKNNPPQTSLKQEERLRNVRGAYGIVNQERIKGRVVLLVDDVFTTGSTIRECATLLRRAGAREVRAVTVAQA